MTYQAKYRISQVVLVLGFVGAATGLLLMLLQILVTGMTLVLVSVAVGIAAGMMNRYAKALKDEKKAQLQIDVETLAKLGERQQREDRQRHS